MGICNKIINFSWTSLSSHGFGSCLGNVEFQCNRIWCHGKSPHHWYALFQHFGFIQCLANVSDINGHPWQNTKYIQPNTGSDSKEQAIAGGLGVYCSSWNEKFVEKGWTNSS
mmetsp:Transcript_19326/g.25013  ORF Transcript_19326/g.25013 Transcript_19326/m.25013 type:complete len:112 (-) Transcript_19326:185-520(-)